MLMALLSTLALAAPGDDAGAPAATPAATPAAMAAATRRHPCDASK